MGIDPKFNYLYREDNCKVYPPYFFINKFSHETKLTSCQNMNKKNEQ